MSILGAGGIGLSMAALMSARNIDVRLWGPTSAGIASLLEGGLLVSTGAVQGEFRVSARLNVAEAVRDVDVVVIAVPGDGHKTVIDLLAPHVRDHQLIAISSHLSLSALYLSKLLCRRGVHAPISAWATTTVTGRRLGPGRVHVGAIRKKVVASALPSERYSYVTQKLINIVGDVFTPAADLMAATLTNVNPVTHAAVALCNLTRMEYRETWGSYYGISPAVGSLIEALDAERVALAGYFGASVHTLQDHWHGSFGLPRGSVGEMAAEQHRRRDGTPAGPARLAHRYVVEDVPFGIVPLIELAKVAGMAVPTHVAVLHVLSVLYRRDFAAENNLLSHLNIEALGKTALISLCKRGFCGPK